MLYCPISFVENEVIVVWLFVIIARFNLKRSLMLFQCKFVTHGEMQKKRRADDMCGKETIGNGLKISTTFDN